MKEISLSEECIAKLQSCTSLPSPPKVALQLMDLVKNPELDIDDVVRILTLDTWNVKRVMGEAGRRRVRVTKSKLLISTQF